MAYLDNKDLKAIKEILEDVLNKKFDEKLVFKLDTLPTRIEFYNRTGMILEKLDSLAQKRGGINST